MNRRDFMKNSAALVAAPLLVSTAVAEEAATRPVAQLNLCSQASRLPGATHKEKVDNLIAFGGVGYELHPPFKPEEVLEAIKGTPVRIGAVCAADGPYIVPDEAQRRRAIDNAKHLLELAGEVGSTGVIMVPAFNGALTQLHNPDAHKVLIDVLHELGEHGEKYKSRMLMEPLNRKEAWYMRHLAHAASVCKEVNSPGVRMMGDLYHMYFEEPNDSGAFISARDYVHHVHIASRIRNLPGKDERSFVDAFSGLKTIGYRDFVSLECNVTGNPKVEITKSFQFLKDQWEQAKVI
ncbi:MAG TPA: TIM barrel protein [Tepidisphaeraceae bacterium]|jgi:sugar phosphate isomerase/epimerase|nr:TIM barrel protein [Tepidisphaeraceae bacterium]